MQYLARDDDTLLLGDDDGFVPATALDPAVTTEADALRAAIDGVPDIDGATASRVPREHVQFSRPLDRPGKLFGIGLNYADHAADLAEDAPSEPASFFKPSTALTSNGGPIRLPPTDRTDRVTAEAELGVVVGRRCRNVAIEDVDDVVAGYTALIDMTAEDVLRRNPRFLTRAKSFDTFLVMGPHIAVPPSSLDLADVTVRTVVNGETEAENRVENMHFSPRELVAFHSDVMTLEPGDVISTGTPGAHEIRPGDDVEAHVDGLCTARASVVR